MEDILLAVLNLAVALVAGFFGGKIAIKSYVASIKVKENSGNVAGRDINVR